MVTDFEKALKVLNESGVSFIVIGGVAGALHGSSIITQDLDVVYSRGRDNLRRLALALKDHRPYLRNVPEGLPFNWDEKTIRNGLNFTLTTTFGDLDRLAKLPAAGLTTIYFPRAKSSLVLVARFNWWILRPLSF